MEKNHPMAPLWIIFKGKIKIHHLRPVQSTRQDDHFLALRTKNFSLLKIAISKVIGPEEMPILVWVRRKCPPTKMGST